MTTAISIRPDGQVRAELGLRYSTHVFQPGPDFCDILQLWVKRAMRHAEVDPFVVCPVCGAEMYFEGTDDPDGTTVDCYICSNDDCQFIDFCEEARA